MAGVEKNKFTFPVGYRRFHKSQLFNFQLNRWYSFGYARLEDMEEAGRNIKDFASWKNEMLKLADRAVSEGRLMNAAFYYRAAEFYVFQEDPDKELLYDKFAGLFYKAVQKDGIERHGVPYNGAFLPALRVFPAAEKKGVIVMHGGFDSYIEEFYSWMRYFSDNGYEVIAFEGPGQGAALRKQGLALDYEWEKPAKAVLDHFRLDGVAWLGISMGGWFCFRAAAFEPRIKKIIASAIAFDYMKMMPAAVEWIHKFLIKQLKNFTARIGAMKLKNAKGMQKWTISNMMYITGKKDPMEAFGAWIEMNEENLHSGLVRQDVLILTGREDHFIPFKMHAMQVKALANARSVTARIFTKKEQAQNHCQVGNTGLALKVMVEWLLSNTSQTAKAGNLP